MIAELTQMGDTVEDILEAYSHLKAAWVYDAIAYYHDHVEEIEAQIEANRIESILAADPDMHMDERGIITFNIQPVNADER